MPEPLKALRRRLLGDLDPLAIARYRRRAGADRPIPPRRLRARSGAPEVDSYVEGGAQAVAELEAALAGQGIRLSETRSVLDFGCGAGRVLPHLRGLGVDLAGRDVDGEVIGWAREHWPGIDWRTCGFEPPLDSPDGAYGLIYSISVFSHLDEPTAADWLRELERVLRPGGFALLSVHGPHAWEMFRSGRVKSSWCAERMTAGSLPANGGFRFEPYKRSRWNRRDLASMPPEYGIAFHTPEYIERAWSTSFEVLDVIDRAMTDWQDLAVLRRR